MYFFDLDGTLLDSNGLWQEIDRVFLGRYGVDPVPPDYTEFVTHHGFPESAAYTRKRYALPLTEEEIMAVWLRMARDAYSGRLPLKPGARDFLGRAAKAGIPCAVATSCLPELCTAALRGHGLTGFFRQVFCTAQVGFDKRDPEYFSAVARACGLSGPDCTLFEDSPVNCAAAKAAGWRVLGVADPMFADRVGELRAACGREDVPFSFLQPLP